MNAVGQFDVAATATDAAGNTGNANASLLVIDPTVGGVPTVRPRRDLPITGVIAAPVDVTGTATIPTCCRTRSRSPRWGQGGDLHEIAIGSRP